MTLGDLIALAFGETMPRGDLGARYLRPNSEPVRAKLIATEDLVLAGLDAFEGAVRFTSSRVEFAWQFAAGDLVLAGQTPCWVKGDERHLLGTERVAIDLLGRACGIATLTRCYVEEIKGSGAAVVNARAGTPGLRDLEFAAVRAGGGVNPEGHYSDLLFVSVNHARAAGSLTRALQFVRSEFNGPVTVECATPDDVTVAVAARAARVVLKNMPLADVTESRRRCPARIPIEAGGTLTLPEAGAIARAGVDFVRVDQLLCSAPRAELEFVVPAAAKPE